MYTILYKMSNVLMFCIYSKNGNDICIITDDRTVHVYQYKNELYVKNSK